MSRINEPPAPPDHRASDAAERGADEAIPTKAAPPQADGYVGCVVDERYRIDVLLGEGSVGLVYRAHHLVIGKPVAIKIIRQEFARDEEIVARFVNEARAASRIGSRHIVDTLDFGQLPNGAAYLVMEYLTGETLGARLERQPMLSVDQVLSVGKQIAEAVGAAHAAQIIHRDLKPDNVFLTESEDGAPSVKILDFGVAKVASAEGRMTRLGTVFGTPHYMAPEQATGGAIDQRADVYALGVILYEMATGTLPFDGETAVSILTQHATSSPPRPSARVPVGRALPRGLEETILRCLEKQPDDRFQSMAELGQALSDICSGANLVPTHRPRPPLLSEPLPFASLARRRLRALSVIGTLVALGVAALLLADSLWPALGEGRAGRESSLVSPPAESAPASSAEPSRVADGNEREVHFVLFPLDSRVFRGKEDLGPMPVSVKVREGERATVIVRRPGFWPRRIVVDGTETRIVIGLVKLPSNAPASLSSAEPSDDQPAAGGPTPSASASPSAPVPEPGTLPRALPAASDERAPATASPTPSSADGE
jgi:serine/threonine-protein kinase